MKFFSILLALLIIAVGFQGETLEQAWSVFVAYAIVYGGFTTKGVLQ